MKKELINRKLLAECIKAASEGKLNKAKRLFAKNFHDTYVSNYKLMEAEEGADDEIISDEFSDEVIGDFEEESSSKYEEAQFAIDELEDKVETYLEEEGEETKQKIDDLRNILDELNASEDMLGESDEECDCAEKEDEARVVIEDIKADFEAKLGELPEDVSDVFVELDKTFEEEVADEEAPVEDEISAEEIEIEEGAEDLGLEAEEEVADEEVIEEPAEEEIEDEDAPFDDEEFKDILLDIRDSQEALEDKFDELVGEKEPVAEEWTKLKVERNGAKNEEEGVVKKAMKLSKVAKIDRKPAMGVSASNSEGKSAQAKIKGNIGRENKGLKGYEKINVKK